jgi:hypothetical protein
MDRWFSFSSEGSMQRFIPCPRCSASLVRDRQLAGKFVVCPACDHSFLMPFETSKVWSPIPLMAWHFLQRPLPSKMASRAMAESLAAGGNDVDGIVADRAIQCPAVISR